MRKRVIVLIFILLFTLLVGGCGSKNEGEKLTVGLVPNQAPEKIKAQYEPFRKYLENQLAMPVELFVATDYSGVVEAMIAEKLDLAYFGGLTYVQARQRAPIEPLVTEINPYTGNTTYQSLIIVPAGSKISSVDELKGKTFAFGDVSSTSGSLYPRIMLDKAGVTAPGDLKNVVYTGGHDATALAVANGTVDAGGIEDRILYRLEEQGTVEKQKIKVLATSDPIEGYPWVQLSSLNPQLKVKIAQAFLKLNDPEILKLMRAQGYARVQADDYDYIEQEARRLGLLNKD